MKLNLQKRYSYQIASPFQLDNEINIINLNKTNNQDELNEIFQSIREEANTNNDPPYNSVKKLTMYIRRNRNLIENIINKVNELLKSISNINLMINIVNIIIELVTERRNHHLNDLIDILIKKLEFIPYTYFASIQKIVNTVGDIIKLDNISIQKYLENTINKIIITLTKQPEQKKERIENTKFYSILLLSKIIENSSLLAYNIITKEENFKNLTKIIENFKDPKLTVRLAVGELIKQFNLILKNRDYESRTKYQTLIFDIILSEYKNHLKESSSDPNNINLISGIIIILKNIYDSEPLYFIKNENIYFNLVEKLSKCINSKSNQIKIQFIKFVPELFQMNSDIFMKKCLGVFLEESNKFLTIKCNNELRKTILVTLGFISLHVKRDNFNICLDNLISLLKILVNEKNIDDEIFKCLADLLNNKLKIYMEVILTKFDINSILLHIFKNGLTAYKIEFLTAIMFSFSNFSMQYISTAIASLQTISLILCDEDFKFEYFYNEIDILGVTDNFIDKNLESILSNVKKYTIKYVNHINYSYANENISNKQEYNINGEIYQIPDYIKCKCLNDLKTMIFALTLFSRIDNNYFLRDMLVFYTEKILPLLPIAKNKIKKKILSLLNCKFIKIFPEDINHSETLLNTIIDSLFYLIFNKIDESTQIYMFQILQKHNLLLDIILKNKEEYCAKFMGLILTDIDKEIKKGIIQMLGSLMERSNDKNYFISLVTKCIKSHLFEIYNCDDIIFKEDLIELIYYKSVYLKKLLDINLIEKILEALTYLNKNYNYEGNIFILTLKIAFELLSSELINYNFLININYSKTVKKYCYFLLIVVINNLKEGGDNTIKTKISLKVLYQIIKILKIDIYNEISSNNIIKSLNSSDLEQKNTSIKSNFQNVKENVKNESINNSSSKNVLNFNFENELLTKTKKLEKIYIVDILIQNIIKCQNDDENLNIIMLIFGLSGAMDPLVMEKIFLNRESTIYRLEGNSYDKNIYEENNFQVQKYNDKKQIIEEINLSDIDPIKYKPILYAIRVLKENMQQEFIRQIINNFNPFITNLDPNDEKLAEIILPDIIEIITNVNDSQKIILFNSIISLIHNYKRIAKENLANLVELIKNNIGIDLYFDKCCDIIKFLFMNFINEMEIYYNQLLPIFLSFLNFNEKNGKEKKYENHIIDLFLAMTKNENIYSYLNIIFYKLIPLFLKTNDFNDNILIFFQKVIRDIVPSSAFYPLIINALIEKIKIYMKDKTSFTKGKNSDLVMTKESKQFFEKILYIFKDMYSIKRENFINFLPMIIKNFKKITIIKSNDYESIILPMILEYPNFNVLNKTNYRTKKIIQPCFPLCKFGFNKIKKGKYSFQNEKRHSNISKKNSINSKININQNSKNVKNKKNMSRRQSIDDDLIIKIFDTTNCLTQKDWHDWLKSTTKILFDQSPSIFLNSSKFLIDYSYPLINELYNYSFLDVYKNINETKKTYLSSNLSRALENPKTPNEILLTIINLEEFSERQNVDMCFLDNYLFGKVAHKCKAYAKALYFYENNFLNKNVFDDNKDLLELYYELKLPESAIGLLTKSSVKNKNRIRRKNSIINEDINKLIDDLNIQRTKNSERNEKEKEYNFYIKMHNYQKALEIISKLLEHEENNRRIKILEKNKNICLSGLYDWEEILSNNSKNNALDEELYGENGIYDISMNKKNKNNISKNNINIELNEDNEDKVIENKIEKEILLSKACMNLGEWKQLENHLINLRINFSYRENSKDIGITNSFLYGNNDINYLNISQGGDENTFFINNSLSFVTNTNLLIDDYNYYNKNIENESSSNLIKIKCSNNFNLSSNMKNKDEISENDRFIYYQGLINENQKLKFLENNEDILFDLNLYASILNIVNSKFDLAMKYINEARKTILSRIKSLLNESYVRGFELLVKNQLLFNLYQIIDYKKNHFGDKLYFQQLVNHWDKNLNIIGKDINIYETFLAIRSLVLPIEKEYIKYLDFVKICRKLNMFSKGEKVLLRLKNKIIQSNNNIENNSLYREIYTQIELSFNKCLFERGQIHESMEKSKYLIDLLDTSSGNSINKSENNLNNNLFELNDKIKSKIYGNFAIFSSKIFNFENNLQKKETGKDNGIINRNINNISNINDNEYIQDQNSNSNIVFDKDAINNYFILALKYNNSSYKLWHNYAMFNYKCYKYIFVQDKKDEKYINKNEKINKVNNKEILLAINAVKGFKNSLFIAGKNKQKTFQDILRLLDIFFSVGNKMDNLLNLINETFNYIDIDVFLNVIPQLLSKFDIKDDKILDVLLNILTKIGITHPHAVLPSLIVMKHSNSKKRKSSSEKVLEKIINQNNNLKKIIDEYELFINELNKCSMLLHEEWFETIEDIFSIFQNGDYNSFTNQMLKLHEKMNKHPKSMYEINFYQKFISELNEAEENILYYKQTKNTDYAKLSWEIYHNIYLKILDYYKSFQIISLEYISPKLFNFKDSNIVIPSKYTSNYESIFLTESDYKNLNYNIINPIIYVKRIGKTLSIFNTKQHPRKMSMIGTNNKEYMFLLKGHEDLRQDERVMQLFDLVNIILAKDNSTANKKLFIDTYTIFPISHNGGIIGWVQNCDTLHQLIKEQRMKANTIPNVENKKIYKSYPKFETGAFLTKVEIFKESLCETHGTELKTVIWEKSKNCETWLNRRTNYSRSLAVMSIVGYILGLGDRHPSNLMMSRKNGKIIHIDFGDCFEVAMKRTKFPEKVPFRLTRMLIKALEVSGIEGTFRLICIQIMELLRKKKDSLLAILGSFVDDPLISFRLMIPLIMKKRKMNKQFKEVENKNNYNKDKNVQKNGGNKRNINNMEKIGSEENLFKSANNINFDNGINIESKSCRNNRENSLLKNNQILKNSEESRKKYSLKYSEKEKEKKVVELKTDTLYKNEEEEKEKEEKKKMEDDERQIFNLFEENDEIESEELNKIGKMILNRIKDKLSGTDIYPDSVYDAQTQVDKLITQATSFENLAQSYLGWCPFW